MEPGALLLLRADANVHTGIGHVMRCLALAQAWQDAGGQVTFATAEITDSLAARLASEGMALRAIAAPLGSRGDAHLTAELAVQLGAAWVVLDGYYFGADYEGRLRERVPRLLAIDDEGHAGRHVADLILDQNLAARATSYVARPAASECLLGPDFALLRRDFRVARVSSRVTAALGRKLLLTMGGTDPAAATETLLDVLEPVAHEFELEVVTGTANPRAAALAERLGWWPSVTRLVLDADMPKRLAWADLAISAAGTTCWELACLGVPALLVSVADNQRPNASAMAAHGAALDLGDVATLDGEALVEALFALAHETERRRLMAERGRALVDGQGARRVVTAMLARDSLRLRKATAEDAQRLFDWANDPVTRAMSFRSESIPWEDHRRWLAAVLADQDRLLLIAEWRVDGVWRPCGQLRLDAGGLVSLGFDPAWRGRGLAAPTLRRALTLPEVAAFGPLYTAFIRPENAASQRAFRQAGFRHAGSARAYEVECDRFERDDSSRDGEGLT